MTVKGDSEHDHSDDMTKRLSAVQAEPWRVHKFVDAEDSESWNFFQENFFVGGAMGQNTEDLQAKVPKLISGVTDEQYLDMISAPIDKNRLKKAKDAKKAQEAERKAKRAKKEKGKGAEAVVGEEDDSSSTLSDFDEPEKDDDDDDVTASA